MRRKPSYTVQYSDLFLRNIPSHVKAKFKVACMRRGLSMNKVIIKLMREYIKQDESSCHDEDLRRIRALKNLYEGKEGR